MPFTVNKLSLLGALSIAAIAVLVALPYMGADNAVAESITHSSSSGTVAFNPETDLVPENARCATDAYIDSSTRTVKTDDMDYRQSATSVSIPFKGTTDDEVTKEIVSEICGNPTVLKMVADDMMLWTGFPGAEENKKVWLQELVDDLNANGLDSFIQKDAKDGSLIVSEKLVMYAGWLNAVLLDSESEGKQSLQSVRNWEVPLMASPKTQPVAVLAADQENKPAWVRSFYDKNDKCLYRIGFNAEDKRLESFNCEIPEETPPPETTSNPGCTTDCGEDSTPDCTNDCVTGGKITTDSSGYNSKIDPFRQNGGEKVTVSEGDGAKVPNGNQGTGADVIAAQKAAQAKAQQDAAAAKAAQEAAKKEAEQSGGSTVETDQDQGGSTGPNW